METNSSLFAALQALIQNIWKAIRILAELDIFLNKFWSLFKTYFIQCHHSVVICGNLCNWNQYSMNRIQSAVELHSLLLISFVNNMFPMKMKYNQAVFIFLDLMLLMQASVNGLTLTRRPHMTFQVYLLKSLNMNPDLNGLLMF